MEHILGALAILVENHRKELQAKDRAVLLKNFGIFRFRGYLERSEKLEVKKLLRNYKEIINSYDQKCILYSYDKHAKLSKRTKLQTCERSLTILDNSLVANCPHTDNDFLKTIMGCFYNRKLRKYTFPLILPKVLLNMFRKKGFKLEEGIKPMEHRKIKKIGKIKGLKAILFPYQHVGVEYINSMKGTCLVADEMGLGKAQPHTSKVLTKNGYVKLGDVKLGDEIYDDKGVLVKINGIFPQGLRDVYVITFSDGTKVECDYEHLWNVNTCTRKFRGNPYMTLPLSKILLNYKSDININKKYHIPLTKPIEFNKKELPLDPYVLGVLLGDGSFRGNTVSITAQDTFIIDEINKSLPENVRAKNLSNNDYSLSKIKVSGCLPNNLTVILRNLDLMGKLSVEKHIPDIYKYSSIDDRVAILQGLFDTDGHVTKDCGSIEYSTSSPHLKDDVLFLVQSLGLTASCSVRKTYRCDNYRIYVFCDNNFTLFKLPRKLNRLKKKTKYFPRRMIKDIEYIGKKECLCISIDNESKLYLTDNCTVTHNTLQSLAYIQYRRKSNTPTLIIMPASLKLNWAKEIDKFLTGISYQVIKGGSDTIDRTKDITLMNYDILKSYVKEIKKVPYKLIIADEVHYVKTPTSQRTKAFLKIIKEIPKRLVLTGTPINNMPIDLFVILHALNPELFKYKANFGVRYCDGKLGRFGWEYKGSSNQKELHTILTSSFMLRRFKKDVLKDLPAKRRIYIPVEVNLAKYEKIKKKIKKELEESENQAQHLALIEKLKQATVELKMDQVISWIEDFLQSGKKLVVFFTHTRFLDQVLAKFKGISVKYNGSCSHKQKDAAVDKFMDDPKCRLFLGNIDAAGTGLTLVAAQDTLHVEFHWKPAVHLQAEDRVHRIGQKESVTSWYVLANNTIENYIFDTICKKESIISAVIDGKDTDVNFVDDVAKQIRRQL